MKKAFMLLAMSILLLASVSPSAGNNSPPVDEPIISKRAENTYKVSAINAEMPAPAPLQAVVAPAHSPELTPAAENIAAFPAQRTAKTLNGYKVVRYAILRYRGIHKVQSTYKTHIPVMRL